MAKATSGRRARLLAPCPPQSDRPRPPGHTVDNPGDRPAWASRCRTKAH